MRPADNEEGERVEGSPHRRLWSICDILPLPLSSSSIPQRHHSISANSTASYTGHPRNGNYPTVGGSQANAVGSGTSSSRPRSCACIAPASAAASS